MRENRLLSLLLTAAMLAAAATFTACSGDKDGTPEKDPTLIVAGEGDPLGEPIGLVYTDFLTPNDVTPSVNNRITSGGREPRGESETSLQDADGRNER